MCDAADHHWDFARKGAELGVSANDLCIAIVGKDLKTTPLPTGQPLSLVPLCLPSHPIGHSKLVTKAPWSRLIAPWWYESEKGLPWLSWDDGKDKQEEVKEKEPPTTFFGWEVFEVEFEKSNSDAFQLLISPLSSYGDYQNSRVRWHEQNSGTGDFRALECASAVEEHAFRLLLLKLVVTKGDAGKLPVAIVDRAMHFLKLYSPDFPVKMRNEMLKIGLLSGRTQFYAQSILEYATAVSSLKVPVNVWFLPYPPGWGGDFKEVVGRSLRS